MKLKTLILVETPLQLLCAYEYMHTHQGDFCLYVRKYGLGINDQQLDTMAKELGLKVAWTFQVKPGDKVAYAKALVYFMVSSFRVYDKVVIGSYFSGLFRVLSSIVVKKELVLLDDGVATLLADKVIKEKKTKKYSAFSIFPLDSTTYKSYQLNRFDSIAGEYACIESQDYAVFFIGQKLVDIGAIEIDAYIRVLEAVVAQAKGQTVHYVPHRTESSECIARIKKVHGIEVLYADVAIEYFMLRNGWYPQKIYSIISTALFTLASLYPKAEATSIRPSTLKTQRFVHYGMIIDALKHHSSVIKFLDVE